MMMDKATDDIHLAFSFDQNYIKPFFVLLTSIFAHNPGEPFQLQVVLTNASTAEKESITSFVEAHHSRISYYDIEVGFVRSFAPQSERYGLATFYRLLLPGMLPATVQKFIYLDIDIVVVGRLRELFATDMGNYPLAAVAEPVDYTRPDLGLHTVGEYFNAGVLLINLSAWQQQQIAEKAIGFLREFPAKAIYLDQDALNAVLAHNWLPLEDKFNFTWRSIPYIPKAELRKFVATKTIVHFNTSIKPWHRLSSSRLDYLYHYFFDLSPVNTTNRFTYIELTWDNVSDYLLRKMSNVYLNNNAIYKIVKFVKRVLVK
jgi:lipopolysaccharide biosynthesis glycosyltransferase